MSREVVHSLGAALCAAAGARWLLTAAWEWRHERLWWRRCTAALAGAAPVAAGRPGPWERSRTRWRRRTKGGRSGAVRRALPAVGALCLAHVLVGGVFGALVGALAGCLALRRRDRRAPAEAPERARAARELPLAADLLAACITAGAGPVTAAGAVGESLGGPVGEALARGAAELRLGGAPDDAWRRLAALPGGDRLATLLGRAAESGAPAAAPVAQLAAEARAGRGRLALARARRAGVLVAAPVGLCFLPAFIAVGVVPVVIGLANGLLRGGS